MVASPAERAGLRLDAELVARHHRAERRAAWKPALSTTRSPNWSSSAKGKPDAGRMPRVRRSDGCVRPVERGHLRVAVGGAGIGAGTGASAQRSGARKQSTVWNSGFAGWQGPWSWRFCSLWALPRRTYPTAPSAGGTARQLIAQAVQSMSGPVDLAVLLSLESMRLSTKAQGRTGLLTGLCWDPHLDDFLHQLPVPIDHTAYLVTCGSLELATYHTSGE